MPTTIGKYTIRREIGRGGMAIVYEADDPDLRRPVALKVVASTDAQSPILRRFRREAELAAKLRHPNIIAVHDIGEAPGDAGATLHYIAMDLIPGRTFREVIAGPDALRLLEDVSRAAGYAHAQGVIHRDLKPDNVLIDPAGRAVLTDFGLARAESEPRLTREGAVLGTPIYMAPEQVEGRNDDIGPPTDVYALGTMLYEVIAGRPPFLAPTAAQVYAQILSAEAPVPKGPVDLVAVCLKAIEKDPGRRYPDAAAFAEDLARARRGDPVQASRSGWLTRAARRMRRRPAVLIVALIAGAAIAFVLRERTRLKDEISRASRPDDSHAVRAADERARAQERAFKIVELARPSLDAALAMLYRADSKYDECRRKAGDALERLDEAAAAAPWLAATPYLAGRARDATGDWDGAETAWRRALELDPAYGPAHFQLGRLLLLRSFLETTGATAEARAAGRSRAQSLATAAARHLEAAGREGSGFDDAVGRDLAAAMAAYARSDIEAMRPLAARHDTEDSHWLRGLACESVAEALEAMDRALARRPRHPAVLFSRGLFRLRSGQLQGAVEDFSAAVEWSPRFIHALNNRGTAHHTLGDLDAAVRDYDAALALDETYADALVNRGLVHATRAESHLAAGRRREAASSLDLAIRDYNNAIERRPEDAHAFNNRGSAYLTMGDVESALRSYSRAVELMPDWTAARHNRGLAKRRLGDTAGALEDYAECIRRDPSYAPAWMSRGIARQEANDHRAAIVDYDRVIALDPASHRAYGNRGVARMNLGDFRQAIEDFDRALKLAPAYLEALGNRGVAKLYLKDRAGAVKDLESALDRAPANWPHRPALEKALAQARAP